MFHLCIISAILKWGILSRRKFVYTTFVIATPFSSRQRLNQNYDTLMYLLRYPFHHRVCIWNKTSPLYIFIYIHSSIKLVYHFHHLSSLYDAKILAFDMKIVWRGVEKCYHLEFLARNKGIFYFNIPFLLIHFWEIISC